MNTANAKTEYTHDLLKKWILENRPESGTPAKFYSYEFMFYIAVQPEAVEGDRTGIRVMNLF